jgi:hypothetical protein
MFEARVRLCDERQPFTLEVVVEPIGTGRLKPELRQRARVHPVHARAHVAREHVLPTFDRELGRDDRRGPVRCVPPGPGAVREVLQDAHGAVVLHLARVEDVHHVSADAGNRLDDLLLGAVVRRVEPQLEVVLLGHVRLHPHVEGLDLRHPHGVRIAHPVQDRLAGDLLREAEPSGPGGHEKQPEESEEEGLHGVPTVIAATWNGVQSQTHAIRGVAPHSDPMAGP